MKKEKLKTPPQNYGRTFLGLWTISYAALWFMTLIWTFINYSNDVNTIKGPSVETTGYIGLLVATNLVALMQQRLMRRSLNGWMISSLIGSVITLVLSIALVGTNDPTMLLRSLTLFVPASIMQAFWLRQHVKSAWLWPLANSVAALSFALISRSPAALGVGIILIGVLQGIIQSIVMRYLWTQPQETKSLTSQIAAEDLAQQQAEALAHQNAVERLNPYETPAQSDTEEHERLTTQETMGEMES